MDNTNEQSLALARFQALQNHRPSSGDESEVAKFREIVDALEKALSLDLSPFRIPDAELKQYEDEHGSTSWVDAGRNLNRFSQLPYSEPFLCGKQKRFCDVDFLQRQIDGIAFYFQNLSPTPKRQNIGF